VSNNPKDTSNSGVRIDVGASVEAKLTAEIPPTAMGRLVDAVTDCFRPFSERRGLRADQIRLQREDVLIEIAKKARERLAIEGGDVHPIPNKFLIPFLEKASLEDPESQLCDLWANLLVEATKSFDPKLGVYVDILSRIGPKDARLLREICFASKYKDGVSWPLGHFAENEARVRASIPLLDRSGEANKLPTSVDDHRPYWLEFKNACTLQYGYLIHATVLLPSGSVFYYGDSIRDFDAITVDRLEAERLLIKKIIQFNAAHDDVARRLAGSVSYFDLSYIAIDLIRICTRNFTIRS
jgi:hypothetical protein